MGELRKAEWSSILARATRANRANSDGATGLLRRFRPFSTCLATYAGDRVMKQLMAIFGRHFDNNYNFDNNCIGRGVFT